MRDNYQQAREEMRKKFRQYDQTAMIERFGLQYTEAFLLVRYFDRMYRIGREDGAVMFETDGEWAEADYGECMVIYDVLSRERLAPLSGEFCLIDSLPGLVQRGYAKAMPGFCEAEERELDGRFDALRQACAAIGVLERGKADLCCRFALFEFLPVKFRFWRGDEEFGPKLQFLWDANLLQFMRYESAHGAMRHMVGRLCRQSEQIP